MADRHEKREITIFKAFAKVSSLQTGERPGAGKGGSIPAGERKQRSRRGIGGGKRRANKPEMDIWKS